ncbi:MAG: hypothetical protein P8M80_08350 [Pirellulaceae bacterium]|jgi:hypothetical protein|nr:hypothetical protein [Pirellulaceae bacterium]MDG2469272.1 hypothetical protein [Pirellulaceae bacterium]
MNYFSHAFQFLKDSAAVEPFFIAGTAVPDWLNVVNRKVRARSKSASRFITDDDPDLSNLAKGIVQHHYDDHWFHQTPVFNELSLQFTIEIRHLLSPDPGFRPSFLGHILIELFLDSELIKRHPDTIQYYYRVMKSLDHSRVEALVSMVTPQPATNLSWFIGRFCEVKFLYDYSCDEKLLGRLNQIMQRVKLPRLPRELCSFFDSARNRVADQLDALLPMEF